MHNFLKFLCAALILTPLAYGSSITQTFSFTSSGTVYSGPTGGGTPFSGLVTVTTVGTTANVTPQYGEFFLGDSNGSSNFTTTISVGGTTYAVPTSLVTGVDPNSGDPANSFIYENATNANFFLAVDSPTLNGYDYSASVSATGTDFYNVFAHDNLTTETFVFANGGQVVFDPNPVTGDFGTATYTVNVSSTPEPSSFMLLGTGLLGAAGMARRRFLKK